MREFGGPPPAGELKFWARCLRQNEFDRRFLRLGLAVLREEHRAFVSPTQMLAQVEFSVDDLTFLLLPRPEHPAYPACLPTSVCLLLYPSTLAGILKCSHSNIGGPTEQGARNA